MAGLQTALQFQPVHPGHVDVGEQAAWTGRDMGEEGVGIGIGADREAAGAQQQG